MIKCIAIDDEPLALKQIVSYVEKTPYLELIAHFENAVPAITFLHEHEVDLMFVDINMPDISGMDFVKSLKDPPKVIFTTAHSKYAVEGFRVDALDYLLKPISYSDFLEAANKAKAWFDMQAIKPSDIKSDKESLFIKAGYKIIRINLSDIKYIEGKGEYVQIHLLNQKPQMTLMSMKKLEETLPPDLFMRVHRSYIVNLKRVSEVERNRIIFDSNIYIPVSEQYKESFQVYLDQNFLL